MLIAAGDSLARPVRRPRGPGPKRQGFTLVELLTVIIIIGLLVGILVPTISAVLKITDSAACKTRINALATGCSAYKTQMGAYPGQRNLNADGSLPSFTGSNFETGSQWLAATMFVYGSTNAPISGYVTLAPDMLDIGGVITQRNNAILDAFAKPMALLYYVSRPGKTGLDQYTAAQNAFLTPNTTNFQARITDARFGGGKPYKDGEFMIIGAGPDRIFFTEDDIESFNR